MHKWYYFGTDLTQAGHYLKRLYSNSLGHIPYSENVDERTLPMNLEWAAPDLTLGTMYGYTCAGYSVLHIVGSCYDKRGGCKSVFIIDKAGMSGQDIFDIVSKTEIVQKMIAQMPFELRHPIIQL